MPKLASLHIFLQIFTLYICFLTFLRPVEAVVERGIAYVDNYDDKFVGGLKARGVEKRDHERHRRANGEGVIEVRAEKVGKAAQVEERDQHATGEGTDDSNNDWLKRAPQWLNKLLKREFERNPPKPAGPYDSHEWNKRGDMHATFDGPDDSHGWPMKRSIESFQKSKPFPPSGVKLKLDKRGMIEEWLHPRGMEKRQWTCENPGYVPCSNSPYCCPSQSKCCPLGCKGDSSDVCCSGYSCEAGYQCDKLCGGCVIAGGGCCPDGLNTCLLGEVCCSDGCADKGNKCCTGGGSCLPGQQCCNDGCAKEGNKCCTTGGGSCLPGEECCNDGCSVEGSVCCVGGGFCDKGNICVMDDSTGDNWCCTDVKCTAYINDGVKKPMFSTINPEPQPAPETTAPPRTTKPPTNNQDVVVYYTYRFTITWWYWYYYYTYWAVEQVSTVTSSRETTTTTVTVTDTATETSSLFKSLSQSVLEDFTTPADATTALATPTIPANTAQDAETDEATTTTTRRSTSTTSRSTSTTSSSVSAGGSGTGSAGMVKVDWWFGYVMMGFAMCAGVGMVWL